MLKALLFDVGDVLIEHNWRLLKLLGETRGYSESTMKELGGEGPFDPQADAAYERVVLGEIHLDEYWNIIAVQWGFDSRIELWRAMSHEVGNRVFAADAFDFVHQARAAHIPIGILTNDLVRSSGRDWVDAQPQFKLFDAFVDCTELGIRKPDPQTYLRASEALGFAPTEVVFLDDMQYCIDGADAVGMTAVLVNPLDRVAAFNQARRLVGLPVHETA